MKNYFKNLKPINQTAKELLIEFGATHSLITAEKRFDKYVKEKNDRMADYYFLVMENLYERLRPKK
jgi:hypothetical protein